MYSDHSLPSYNSLSSCRDLFLGCDWKKILGIKNKHWRNACANTKIENCSEVGFHACIWQNSSFTPMHVSLYLTAEIFQCQEISSPDLYVLAWKQTNRQAGVLQQLCDYSQWSECFFKGEDRRLWCRFKIYFFFLFHCTLHPICMCSICYNDQAFLCVTMSFHKHWAEFRKKVSYWKNTYFEKTDCIVFYLKIKTSSQ